MSSECAGAAVEPTTPNLQFPPCQPLTFFIISRSPCEGRIAGVVDVPNACVSLAIPVAIFDQDIRPNKDGPPTGPRLINRGGVLPQVPYEGDLPRTAIPFNKPE